MKKKYEYNLQFYMPYTLNVTAFVGIIKSNEIINAADQIQDEYQILIKLGIKRNYNIYLEMTRQTKHTTEKCEFTINKHIKEKT